MPTIDRTGELMPVFEHGMPSVQGRDCASPQCANRPHSLIPRAQSRGPNLSPVSWQGCPSLLHWLFSWSVLMSSSVVTVGESVTVFFSLQPFCSFLMSYKPHCDSWENGSLSQSNRPWTPRNLCGWNGGLTPTHHGDRLSRRFLCMTLLQRWV